MVYVQNLVNKPMSATLNSDTAMRQMHFGRGFCAGGLDIGDLVHFRRKVCAVCIPTELLWTGIAQSL